MNIKCESQGALRAHQFHKSNRCSGFNLAYGHVRGTNLFILQIRQEKVKVSPPKMFFYNIYFYFWPNICHEPFQVNIWYWCSVQQLKTNCLRAALTDFLGSVNKRKCGEHSITWVERTFYRAQDTSTGFQATNYHSGCCSGLRKRRIHSLNNIRIKRRTRPTCSKNKRIQRGPLRAHVVVV